MAVARKGMGMRRSHPGRRPSSRVILGRAPLATIVAFTAVTLAGPDASAATLTPPDMKILVPTNLISLGVDGATGHRQLRYTHITEDAGTGPFEIDPTYNPTTGVASFVQSLYSSSSPGVWTFDHAVPLAVNGAFVSLPGLLPQPTSNDGPQGVGIG